MPPPEAAEIPPFSRVSPAQSAASPVEVWRGEDAARARTLGKALGAEDIFSWLLTRHDLRRIAAARRKRSRRAPIRIVRALRAKATSA